ncbi:hypothetical protein [Gorillibacterium sp. sgz5001074]|uniref:hypothetical protein n=1 Tax=Gorillibacterium sp. sgz5001074 TaxID=3446695 RepID=UPI003F679841
MKALVVHMVSGKTFSIHGPAAEKLLNMYQSLDWSKPIDINEDGKVKVIINLRYVEGVVPVE